MTDWANYFLGKTNEAMQLDSRAENSLVSVSMVSQSRHALNIISRQLDTAVFGTPEFTEAVKTMILRHNRAAIKIIVFDTDYIAKRGHRLLGLAGQLSSFIETRRAHHSFDSYNECLLVVDSVGYIHRENGSRYEATVNFNDRSSCSDLLSRFSSMWETATPDPNLRRMAL